MRSRRIPVLPHLCTAAARHWLGATKQWELFSRASTAPAASPSSPSAKSSSHKSDAWPPAKPSLPPPGAFPQNSSFTPSAPSTATAKGANPKPWPAPIANPSALPRPPIALLPSYFHRRLRLPRRRRRPHCRRSRSRGAKRDDSPESHPLRPIRRRNPRRLHFRRPKAAQFRFSMHNRRGITTEKGLLRVSASPW